MHSLIYSPEKAINLQLLELLDQLSALERAVKKVSEKRKTLWIVTGESTPNSASWRVSFSFVCSLIVAYCFVVSHGRNLGSSLRDMEGRSLISERETYASFLYFTT